MMHVSRGWLCKRLVCVVGHSQQQHSITTGWSMSLSLTVSQYSCYFVWHGRWGWWSVEWTLACHTTRSTMQVSAFSRMKAACSSPPTKASTRAYLQLMPLTASEGSAFKPADVLQVRPVALVCAVLSVAPSVMQSVIGGYYFLHGSC